MLTLPAEITNNKNKVGIKPLLLIEFADLDYHIASKAYNLSVGSGSDGSTIDEYLTSASATFITWNIKIGDIVILDGSDYEVADVISEVEIQLSDVPGDDTGLEWEIWSVYSDLIKKGMNLNLTENVNQLVSKVSSIGGTTLTLTDWVGTLRADLIGSSPDLTNSTVNIYLKLDTTTDLMSNALLIYKGKVASYDIQRNIMTIKLKILDNILADVPQNPVTEKSTTLKPIHYGDFAVDGTAANFVYWYDFTFRGAAAVQVYWDTDKAEAKYWLSDHEMNAITGNSSGGLVWYVVRDGLFCVMSMADSPTITNGATGCWFTFTTAAAWDVHVYLPPTATESGANTASDPHLSYDGKSSTYCRIDGTQYLSVETFGFDDLSANTFNTTPTIRVSLGTVTGSTWRIEVTDGVNTNSVTFDNTDSDTQITAPFPAAANSMAELEDYHVEIHRSSGDSGVTADIKNIIATVQSQNISSSDTKIYVTRTTIGREFSGTWNSRKTAGNPILYIPDVIESLLRDEWSFGDANIDMDSFDNIFTYVSSTITSEACGSIYQKTAGYTLLNQICKMFNLALTYGISNKWKLLSPIAAANNFANSGTGTPGTEDIFSDTLTKTSGAYDYHPIAKGTFKLSRSSENENYGLITFNFDKNDSAYAYQTQTGSGKEIILNNSFISEWGFAVTYLGGIDNWLLNQKWIVDFTTFYNAVAFEIGDVINIRHAAMNDAMLDATVNTQKWMIIKIIKNWRPNTIDITAIELL